MRINLGFIGSPCEDVSSRAREIDRISYTTAIIRGMPITAGTHRHSVLLSEVDPVRRTGWLCGDAVAVTVVQVLVFVGVVVINGRA